MTRVRIRRAERDSVGELQGLWASMHAHHTSIGRSLAPTRPLEESWLLRRLQYESWLKTGEGHLLIAECEAELVGYAFVRIEPGPPTWDVGAQVAELESLAVLPQHRGGGVGAMLIGAARDVASSSGAERLTVGVAHSNSDALRFYEREGFAPFYDLLLERPGRSAASVPSEATDAAPPSTETAPGAAEPAPGAREMSIAPQLAVRRGREAVAFYEAAFGAVELYRLGGTDEDVDLVSQLSVDGASFWVSDEAPAHLNFSPESLGGGTVRVLLTVDDPQAVHERALSAGAKEIRPVAAEHGWLLGRLEDPFGHHWEVGRPLGR